MKNAVYFVLFVSILVLGFLGCDSGNGTTSYTVTFNSDGGSSVNSVTEIPNGTTIILPPMPTKGLWVFSGWHTELNGGGIEFTSDTLVTGNITVYAKWISIFEGTWNIYSGPSGLQLIVSGNEVLTIFGNTTKRSSFTYNEEYFTETIIEIIGDGGQEFGNVGDPPRTISYILDGNELTFPDPEINQVFHREIWL